MTRPHLVAFRLTAEEHTHLATAARAARLAPAAWCRRTVLERLAATAPPTGTAAPTAAPLAAAPSPPPSGLPAALPSAAGPPPPIRSAGAPAALAIPAAGAPTPAAPAPPASEPLSRVVAARLTPSQRFDLETRAKGAGVTVGTYLRHLVRGHPPTARWPLARAAIVQLARVGNNLNQLVKLAHSGTPLPLELHATVLRVLGEVRRLRRALQDEPRG
jgi:Bacterial mobilisation protein (MobC)